MSDRKTPLPNLSHKDLFEIFGDFIYECPEVVPALRTMEIKHRSQHLEKNGVNGANVRMPTNLGKSSFKLSFGNRIQD